MLEAVLVAAAVFSVVGAVACDSPDESRTIGATAVDSSRAARFGCVLLECGFALRRREVARVLEEAVVTTEVEEVCAFGSTVTGVTVSTVDCVVDGATGAGDNNETDVEEEASVVTEAATAILGGTIVPEIVVGVGLVTTVDIGVIVTFNAGCTNRLKTGRIVLERL